MVVGQELTNPVDEGNGHCANRAKQSSTQPTRVNSEQVLAASFSRCHHGIGGNELVSGLFTYPVLPIGGIGPEWRGKIAAARCKLEGFR